MPRSTLLHQPFRSCSLFCVISESAGTTGHKVDNASVMSDPRDGALSVLCLSSTPCSVLRHQSLQSYCLHPTQKGVRTCHCTKAMPQSVQPQTNQETLLRLDDVVPEQRAQKTRLSRCHLARDTQIVLRLQRRHLQHHFGPLVHALCALRVSCDQHPFDRLVICITTTTNQQSVSQREK